MCECDIYANRAYMAEVKRAHRLGLYMCQCGFEYFKTVDNCPNCGKAQEWQNLE